jgi:very-short-patch-repair endonuclease
MRDIPAELLAKPFTIAMADSAGVTLAQLRGNRCRRLFYGVYIGSEVEITVEVMAAAVGLILPPGAFVAGTTSALLHGADVRLPGDLGIDVTAGRCANINRRGVRSRESLLEPGDVTEVMGIPVLTPVRTAFDLARNRNLIEAVVGIDAMLNRGGCALDELSAYIAGRPGWWGIRWARRALGHAEPLAASPQETRLRMHLVLGGLPRPRAQVPIEDHNHVPVAYLDLGYEKWKVGPEYDGREHEKQWQYDIERHELIDSLGWWHRRYTSMTIGPGWGRAVREVGAALLKRGWRPAA